MPNWLLDSMSARGERSALDGPWGQTTYADLVGAVDDWSSILAFVKPGAVVAFDADCSPGSISLLLALACKRNIMVPLAPGLAAHHDAIVELSQAEYRITSVETEPLMRSTGRQADHLLYAELRRLDRPGLVHVSNASLSARKYAVHDLSILLDNHREPRRGSRTLLALPLDHIAGVNMLIGALAHGGTAVVPSPADAPADALVSAGGGQVLEHATAVGELLG